MQSKCRPSFLLGFSHFSVSVEDFLDGDFGVGFAIPYRTYKHSAEEYFGFFRCLHDGFGTQIPPKAQKEIISDTAVDPGLTFPQALDVADSSASRIIPRDCHRRTCHQSQANLPPVPGVKGLSTRRCANEAPQSHVSAVRLQSAGVVDDILDRQVKWVVRRWRLLHNELFGAKLDLSACTDRFQTLH